MIRGSNYEELLVSFAPRMIQTESEYEVALERINQLLTLRELNAAEKDMLALLSSLVQIYEEQHYPAEQFESRGIELLRGLLELHGLRQADLLSIFKTRSIASAVLNHKRRLTVEHINGLAHYFQLPHALFFEPISSPIVA